MKRPPTSR